MPLDFSRRILRRLISHQHLCERIAFVLLALLLLGICVSRLLYPFDVGHFEACTWRPAMMSAQGQNPYAYALREPYVMAPYGYFYYLVVGLGLRAFGWQFWFGRGLTVLAAVVCLACIVRLSLWFTSNRRAAFLSALTFLSSMTVYHWVAVHRPDFIAMALALVAMMLVFESKGEADRITLRTALVVVLFSAALLSKQTMVLPIIVAAARCLQLRRVKQAIGIVFGVLTVCAVAAIVLNATSGGGYLWQHFTLMSRIPRDYGRSLQWLLSLAKSPSAWFAIGVIGAGAIKGFSLRGNRPRSRGELVSLFSSPVYLIYGYLVVSFIFGFVSSARSGSYINYFLEATVALALGVSISWRRLEMHWKQQYLHLVVAGLLVMSGGIEFSRMARAESYRWRSLGYYREIVETIAREVPAQRTIISVHPELAVASGRDYHFGDWIQYYDARSDELREVLKTAIASRRYAAIVWLNPDDKSMPLDPYRHIPMKHPLPDKYYPVYLLLLDVETQR